MRNCLDDLHLKRQFTNARNILKPIERQYGTGNALDLYELFEATNLPIPRSGEYGITSEGGIIFFAEDHGTVMRINSREHHPVYRHDLVLQPLGSLHTELIKLDISPGINAPAPHADFYELYAALKQSGLKWDDIKIENLGILPSGRITIIDTPSVRINPAAKTAFTPKQSLHQDAIFANIKAQFKRATKNKEPAEILNEDMKNFWQACKNAKEMGLLKVTWPLEKIAKILDYDKEDIRLYKRKIDTPSKRYTERLSRNL